MDGQFELIFNTTPDAIVITRFSDGIIVDINEGFTKITGLSRADTIGKTVLEAGLWRYPEDRMKFISELTDHGSVENTETAFYDKNGAELICLLSAKVFPLGDVPHIISVIHDITKRKQTEGALKKSEEKYRNIFENIQDVYYEAALDATILEVTPSIVRFSKGQYTRENVIGKSLFEFYAVPEEREKFYAELKAKGRVDDFEFSLKNKDGEILFVSIASYLILDAEGRPEKVAGSLRDITARKNAEMALLKSNRELEKLNSTKDKFFSIVAHDLRSPFNGFLGLLALMEDEFDELTKEQLFKYIHAIGNSARNLFNLLENLLEWSRLQMELATVDKSPLLIRSIIDTNIQLAADQALKKNISLTCTVPAGQMVYADERMLDSIFRNLISNGLKFTQTGGKVTVFSRKTADGFIEIAVQDTGMGMEKSRVGELFIITANTSRKGTDGEPSSGLGLILCKEFVERNGGKIRVESQEGVGTIFYFTLPESEV